MADVALVRKRVRTAIEQARRDQAERRDRAAEAQKSYDAFLENSAIPVFRMIANILKSEGLNFEVATPAVASDAAGPRPLAAPTSSSTASRSGSSSSGPPDPRKRPDR